MLVPCWQARPVRAHTEIQDGSAPAFLLVPPICDTRTPLPYSLAGRHFQSHISGRGKIVPMHYPAQPICGTMTRIPDSPAERLFPVRTYTQAQTAHGHRL